MPNDEAWSSWQERVVRVVRVGKSASNDYRTLAEGIAAARSGDRVEVESGEYFEAVSIPCGIELVGGEVSDPPTISSRGPCINMNTEEPCLLRNLRVEAKGSKPQDAVAILVVKGNPVIHQCQLSSLHVVNAGAPHVSECVISNTAMGSGVRLSDRAGGQFVKNEISNHPGSCVEVSASTGAEFRENFISQRSMKHGSLVQIVGGKHGKNCAPVFVANLISGTGDSPQSQSLQLAFDAPARLSGSMDSVNALMTISWGAAPRLQSNILAYGAIGIQIIDSSVSDVSQNRVSFCSSWALHVVGADANVSIASNEFTACGGGGRLVGVGAITLAGCTFSNNISWGLLVERCCPTLDRCTFRANDIGVALTSGADTQFSFCIVSENKSTGVLVSGRSSGHFSDNEISRSRGAGVAISGGSRTTLKRNVIRESGTHNVVVHEASTLIAVENRLGQPRFHNIALSDRSDGDIQSNDFEECHHYAHIAIAKHSRGYWARNVLKNGHGAGFSVETGSSPTIVSNTIGSVSQAIHVSSRGDPFVTLNDVTTCTVGFLVVEEGLGTFVGNNVRLCTEALVVVESGGAPTCRDNRLSICSSVGIHVRNGGCGVFEKNTVSDCQGGCVVISGDDSDPVIANNFFGGGAVPDLFGILSTMKARGLVCRNHVAKSLKWGFCSREGGETVFRQNVLRSCVAVGLQCDALGKSVFEENDVGDSRHHGVLIHSDSAGRFRGNRIAGSHRQAVVVSAGACCTFEDDLIEDNLNCGIACHGSAPNTVFRRGCVRRNQDTGIVADGRGGCRFEECVVESNASPSGCVFDNAGSATVLLSCTVEGHAMNIYLLNGGEATFEKCTIRASTKGPLVVSARGGRAVFVDCAFSASPTVGIHTLTQGSVTLRQCSISDCSEAGIKVEDGEVDSTDCRLTTCCRGVVFASRAKNGGNASPGGPHNPIAWRGASITEGRSASATALLPTGSASAAAAVTAFRGGSIFACEEEGVLFAANSKGVMIGVDVHHCNAGFSLHEGCHAVVQECTARDHATHGFGIFGSPHPEGKLDRNQSTQNRGLGVVFESCHHARVHHLYLQSHSSATPTAATATPPACPSPLALGGFGLATTSTNANARAHLNDLSSSGSVWEGGAVSHNVEGGIVVRRSQLRLSGVAVSQHIGVGLQLCEHSIADCVRCVFDSNDDAGIAVGAGVTANLQMCTIRNSDAGVRVDPGARCRLVDSSLSINRVAVRVNGDDTTKAAAGSAPTIDPAHAAALLTGAAMTSALLAVTDPLLGGGGGGGGGGGSAANSAASPVFLPASPVAAAPSVIPAHGTTGIAATKTPQPLSPMQLQPQQQPHTFLQHHPTQMSPARGLPAAGAVSVTVQSCLFDQNVTAVLCMRNRVLVRDSQFVHNSRAGLLFDEECLIDSARCQFTSNAVGVLIQHERSLGIVLDSTFSLNQSGVECESSDSLVVIARNVFRENVVYGLRAVAGQRLVVQENVFEKNHVAGVSLTSAHLDLSHCTFKSENTAIDLAERFSGTISRCTFEDCNTGICVRDSGTQPVLTRCSFTDNTVGVQCTGDCSPTLTYCTFAANVRCGLLCERGANPQVRACLLERHGAPSATTTATPGPTAIANLGASSAPDISVVTSPSKSRGSANGPAAVLVTRGGSGTIQECELSFNDTGILVSDSADGPLFSVRRNRITDNSGYGVALRAAGNVEIARNYFARNGLGDVLASGSIDGTDGASPLSSQHGSRRSTVVSATPAVARSKRQKSNGRGITIEFNAFTSAACGVRFARDVVGDIVSNRFEGTEVGVDCISGAAPRVLANLFQKSLEAGIVVGDAGSSGVFEGNVMQGCGLGVWVKTGGEGIFSSNHILNCRQTGVLVEAEASSPTFLLNIVAAGVENSGRPVVTLKGAGRFATNLVSANGTVGVHCGEGSTWEVSQNRVKECRVGIVAAAGSEGRIFQNAVSQCETGVSLAAGSRVAFTRNGVHNNQLGLVVSSSEATVEGNTLFGPTEGSAVRVQAGPGVDAAVMKSNTVRNSVHGAAGEAEKGTVGGANVVPMHVIRNIAATLSVGPEGREPSSPKATAAGAAPTTPASAAATFAPEASSANFQPPLTDATSMLSTFPSMSISASSSLALQQQSLTGSTSMGMFDLRDALRRSSIPAPTWERLAAPPHPTAAGTAGSATAGADSNTGATDSKVGVGPKALLSVDLAHSTSLAGSSRQKGAQLPLSLRRHVSAVLALAATSKKSRGGGGGGDLQPNGAPSITIGEYNDAGENGGVSLASTTRGGKRKKVVVGGVTASAESSEMRTEASVTPSPIPATPMGNNLRESLGDSSLQSPGSVGSTGIPHQRSPGAPLFVIPAELLRAAEIAVGLVRTPPRVQKPVRRTRIAQLAGNASPSSSGATAGGNSGGGGDDGLGRSSCSTSDAAATGSLPAHSQSGSFFSRASASENAHDMEGDRDVDLVLYDDGLDSAESAQEGASLSDFPTKEDAGPLLLSGSTSMRLEGDRGTGEPDTRSPPSAGAVAVAERGEQGEDGEEDPDEDSSGGGDDAPSGALLPQLGRGSNAAAAGHGGKAVATSNAAPSACVGVVAEWWLDEDGNEPPVAMPTTAEVALRQPKSGGSSKRSSASGRGGGTREAARFPRVPLVATAAAAAATAAAVVATGAGAGARLPTAAPPPRVPRPPARPPLALPFPAQPRATTARSPPDRRGAPRGESGATTARAANGRRSPVRVAACDVGLGPVVRTLGERCAAERAARDDALRCGSLPSRRGRSRVGGSVVDARASSSAATTATFDILRPAETSPFVGCTPIAFHSLLEGGAGTPAFRSVLRRLGVIELATLDFSGR